MATNGSFVVEKWLAKNQLPDGMFYMPDKAKKFMTVGRAPDVSDETFTKGRAKAQKALANLNEINLAALLGNFATKKAAPPAAPTNKALEAAKLQALIIGLKASNKDAVKRLASFTDMTELLAIAAGVGLTGKALSAMKPVKLQAEIVKHLAKVPQKVEAAPAAPKVKPEKAIKPKADKLVKWAQETRAMYASDEFHSRLHPASNVPFSQASVCALEDILKDRLFFKSVADGLGEEPVKIVWHILAYKGKDGKLSYQVCGEGEARGDDVIGKSFTSPAKAWAELGKLSGWTA